MAERSLLIETVADSDQVTLLLSGDVDLLTVPSLVEACDHAASQGLQRLVLDLAAVEFIDSSGLNALVRVHRRFEEDEGGKLVVRSPSARVSRLLELTGVDTFLQIEP